MREHNDEHCDGKAGGGPKARPPAKTHNPIIPLLGTYPGLSSDNFWVGRASMGTQV